jgi:uncharacterized membrane protein
VRNRRSPEPATTTQRQALAAACAQAAETIRSARAARVRADLVRQTVRDVLAQVARSLDEPAKPGG